jgi:type II secretory pathway component PulF
MEEKALVMPKSQRERVKERRETSLLAKVREPFLRAAHWQAATTLFRYLHHAYKAGIPLEDAVASFGPAHPFLSRSIQAPLQRALVQPNMPLSEMLADIGGDISPAVHALLRAGERHGRWEIVLEALREHAEQEREFSLKEMRAQFFVIGVAMALQALVVVGFAILTSLFLPPLKLLLVLLAIIGALKKLRPLLATVLNLLPLAKERSWARFAHTLGVLLKAGVPPSEALEAAAETAYPYLPHLSRFVHERVGQVRQGTSLSRVLAMLDGAPPEIAQAVALGERTGTMDEHLVRVAHALNQEAETVEFRRGLATAISVYLTVMIGSVLLGLFLLATGLLTQMLVRSLQSP